MGETLQAICHSIAAATFHRILADGAATRIGADRRATKSRSAASILSYAPCGD